MKQLASAGLLALALVLAGCGGEPGEDSAAQSSAATAESSESSSASAAASECEAGGLDAMNALADFQLEMDDAAKAGKITSEELIRQREKLFNETQAAQEKSDWAAYCKVIEDTRAELGL